jgi:hypothetical protein
MPNVVCVDDEIPNEDGDGIDVNAEERPKGKK